MMFNHDVGKRKKKMDFQTQIMAVNQKILMDSFVIYSDHMKAETKADLKKVILMESNAI